MGNDGESPPTVQEGDSQVDVARITKPVVRVPFEESMIDGKRLKLHQLHHVLTTSMESLSKTTDMTASVFVHPFHVSLCSSFGTVAATRNKS